MTQLGVIALDGMYLAAGAGVLRALGFAESWRSLARHGGLAFVVGWAVIGCTASYMLMLGFAATIVQVLAAAAIVVAAAYVPLTRVERPANAPWRPLRGRVAIASCGLLCLYGALLLWRSLVSGLTWWDSWAFWVPKGMSIVYFGGLDTKPGGFTSFANPDYPPLVPALHALGLRFAGEVEPTAIVVQDWALAAAFVWALVGLLAPRVDTRVLWPSLLVLVAVPNFGRQVGALTGDLPLGVVFAVAGLCCVLWRLERAPAYGVVAGVLVAAAPLIKKEGLFLVLMMIVLLAAVTAPWLSREQLRALAPALLAGLAILPWYVWLRVEDVPVRTDYDPAKFLDVGFLADRPGRLAVVLRELPWYFVDPSLWLFALPLAVAAAFATWRSAPQVARFVVALAAVSFVGAALVYWISSLDVEYHLASSAARVPTAPVFLVLALVPLLLASLADAPPGARRSG